MRTSSLLATVAALTCGIVMLPAAAFAKPVGTWHMDESSGASVMVDAAGGDDNGTIRNVITGRPGLVSGGAYEFNGATSSITVPDVADRFDPLMQPITIKATIRVGTGSMTDDSYEIIRKGYVDTKPGSWKMEVKRTSTHTVGKLHCVFRGTKPDGTRPTAQIQPGPDLADGRVHTVTCTRTSTGITATIDGRTYRNTRTTGSISNTQPVMVGNKVAGDDVFLGVLDEVSVDIG